MALLPKGNAIPTGEAEEGLAGAAAEAQGAEAQGAEGCNAGPRLEEDEEQQQQQASVPQTAQSAASEPMALLAPQEATSSSSGTPACTASAEADALAAARTASIPPVQVCVRLRPLLPWERAEGHESTALDLQDGLEGAVTLKAKEGATVDEATRVRGFRFNAVFGPEQTQQDMWDMAQIDALVGRVAAGFHATIFAYGQTGSGKTHTMEGYNYNHHNGSAAPSSAAGRCRVKLKGTTSEQLGIVPRCVQRLYAHAEALIAQQRAEGSPEESFSIKVSFLQIYKEKIFDLLNPSHTPAQREAGKGEGFSGLRMRCDTTRRQFFVENLFEYECASAEEVLQHYTTGVQNKHVASTGMNVASSRSHTVLVVTLVRSIGASPCPDNPHAPVPVVKEVVSKLALVDLAGSERSSSSTNTSSNPSERGGTRFQEAVNINQSLFVLRKVITALAKRNKGTTLPSARGGHGQLGQSGDVSHIPYRESKLTSLLQHAIGGNSFLLMIACLSPSDRHYEENLSTLQYASQAASIKNEPIMNVDPKDRLIDHLKAQLSAAHRYILRVTGLEQLPEEIFVTAPAPHHRRNSQTLQRRTFSCDRRAPSAPSSGTSASGNRTWSSEFCPPRAPLAERSNAFSHSGAAALHLTNESSAAPASRGSSDASASSAICEETGAGSICPSSDLLLAAGSAYRPGATGSGTSPCGSIGTGRTSPRRPPGSQKARPPFPSAPAWSSAAAKEAALPPIAPFSGGPLAAKALVPCPGEGLAAYGEVQNGPLPHCPGWGSATQRRKRRGGSQPAPRGGSHNTSTSEGVEGSVAESGGHEQGSGHNLSEAAAAAVDSGLWEALEELRIGKMGLEEKLRGAESREGALKLQVQDLRVELKTPSPCNLEAKSESPLEALMRSENAALRRSVSLLEERLEAARSWESEHVTNVKEARETEARAIQELRETMRSENEALRRERKSMQERLEIFEKALALDSPRKGAIDIGLDLDNTQGKTSLGLGEKLEKLHSQFVLEVVGLRREVAGLKKKKWVLRSVLASGGETERIAIENEVMELRKSTGGVGFKKAQVCDHSNDEKANMINTL